MSGIVGRSLWVLALSALGCAAQTRSVRSSTPEISRSSKPAARIETTPLRTAESDALHAAILASVSSTEPAATEEVSPPTALEPIEPLVRDDTPDYGGMDEASGPSTGRLPPESIRRVIHQSAGVFRDCYHRALLKNPASSGRVLVRFVIAADGRVALAEERGTSLEDRDARRCVLAGFFNLTFPNPAGQTIAVDYPLIFTPDGSVPPDVMPSARKIADPPPPGFAEAMRSGRRAAPVGPVVPPPAPRLRGSRPTHCKAGDPMCSEL